MSVLSRYLDKLSHVLRWYDISGEDGTDPEADECLSAGYIKDGHDVLLMLCTYDGGASRTLYCANGPREWQIIPATQSQLLTFRRKLEMSRECECCHHPEEAHFSKCLVVDRNQKGEPFECGCQKFKYTEGPIPPDTA